MALRSSETPVRRLPHRVSFWVVAVAFLTVMSFTTVSTPLYPLYQQRDHFASFMITVIFAAYGIGVVVGLLLLGHVSDRAGRRRMLLVSVALQLVSAVLFALSSSVPALLVARFVCGFGIGTLTAAATAHLVELHAVGYPRRGAGFASTVATVVNTGGLALGPLVGGLLTQWWPHPLTLPFVVYAVVLVVVGALLLAAPETVEPPEHPAPYRPQRVRVLAEGRTEFFAAALGAATAFSVLGTFTSLTASFVVAVLGHPSRLLAGLVVFGVMASSAVSQVVLVRLRTRTRVGLGGILLVVGLATTAAAAMAESLPGYALGGVVAGGGVGLVFQAAVATAARVATPGHQAETVAGMFLAAYVGITVPVIAVGVAVTLVGEVVPVLVVFAVVVGLASAAAVFGGMLRSPAPADERLTSR